MTSEKTIILFISVYSQDDEVYQKEQIIALKTTTKTKTTTKKISFISVWKTCCDAKMGRET